MNRPYLSIIYVRIYGAQVSLEGHALQLEHYFVATGTYLPIFNICAYLWCPSFSRGMRLFEISIGIYLSIYKGARWPEAAE